MRLVAVIALGLALSSCEKASTVASREASLVERSGDRDAICEAKKKIAAAFLSENNEAAYLREKNQADIYCMATRLERANGITS